MDGKIKNVLKLILILICITSFSFAFQIEDCAKLYSKDADSLFMDVLSALSQSGKYEISEIQTKNGYILFLYGSKYYLLTLTKRYQNQTEIKILPQNSDFSQGFEVIQSVFNTIDEGIKSRPLKEVK